ncbi:hypothetical protein PIROE2DRAFT_10038 [Piromyces sp. E2]|nr:hypothetical protein PIROE2DRAFT_10038 [Piromyces sp. E2]|eukprot:OUM63434.1 hypothetical protein PIROE2DRAFT_10038 [Piromyces sp. E2]
MKLNKINTFLSLLTTLYLVNASRSDFYGKNDNRPKLFKLLDDHVGTIKINLDDDMWASMKKKSEFPPWDFTRKLEKYGTTNATMEFYIDGTDYKASLGPNQFNFYLAGQGSRQYVKPGYNIKLEKGSIYDVKLLRLRANNRDPTLLHEKLSTDMLYKMGYPTTSTNYVNVEVNGEDLGLYVLTNKIKKDFIKKHFGDSDTENLYDCKESNTRFDDNSTVSGCTNSKEELADYKDDLQKLTDAINNAKSRKDLEDILDIDSFLKAFAFEFITLSYDHYLLNSHNFSLYKKPDGKWAILLNDFDEAWGADFTIFTVRHSKFADKSYIPKNTVLYLPNISLRDFDVGHKIVKLLIYDDETRFREIIGEAVKVFFNPKILNERIDELSDLIREHVANSRVIDDKTGMCKGCFNVIGLNTHWNITHFDDCTRYGNWISNNSNTFSYGLKFFIEERFNYLCHTYGINPETLELIEPRPKVSFWGIKNKYSVAYTNYNFFLIDNLMDTIDYPEILVKFSFPDLDKEDFKQKSYNDDPEKNDKPVGYQYPPFAYELEELGQGETKVDLEESVKPKNDVNLEESVKPETEVDIEESIKPETDTDSDEEVEVTVGDDVMEMEEDSEGESDEE